MWGFLFFGGQKMLPDGSFARRSSKGKGAFIFVGIVYITCAHWPPKIRKPLPNLADCPALTFGPGSLDVVITYVNLTAPTELQVRKDGLCMPKSPGGGPFGCNNSFPCCFEGRCHVASHEVCDCPTCFDYRSAGASNTFQEAKYLVRSLEKHGLGVLTPENPRGPVRKIFLIYNECNGNGPPTWIDETEKDYIVAVHHREIFPEPDVMLPSFSRNAIQTSTYRIPGLLPWFLQFEDDMLLINDFDISKFYRSGKIVTYLDRMSQFWSNHGWTGAAHFSASLARNGGLVHIVEGNHIPQLVSTCAWEQMEIAYADELRRTRLSKYDQPDDIQFQTVNSHVMGASGLGENDGVWLLSWLWALVKSTVLWHPYSIWTPAINLHYRSPLFGNSTEMARNALCAVWNDRQSQILNQQGVGVSDDYITEFKPEMGIRKSSHEWKEATYPKPSPGEKHEANYHNSVSQSQLAARWGCRLSV